MSITLESLERAARRALEEDDTVPATRRDLEPPPHLFLLERRLADDAATRDAQVRVRLDSLRDKVSGPYVVNGRSVKARPVYATRTTQPPLDIVRITQTLLDNGRLPEGDEDLAERIRKLQEEHGIGFDSQGYAREAMRVVTARDPVPDVFGRIEFEEIQAGDLLVLEEQMVVVYKTELLDDARLDRYRTRGATLEPRTHRMFEVDGSWNAGREGGYRRDTWLFDHEARTWGAWNARTGEFGVDRVGPGGERYRRAFRLRP